MSLIVKPPFFTYNKSNRANSPSGSPGTAVNSGASNADGTSISLLSATTYDTEYLVVGVYGYRLSTAVGDTLLDILVDPAGGTSWTPLISDLLVGYTPIAATGVPVALWFHFPVFIKAGSTVGARARSRHTAALTNGMVIVDVYGANQNPGSWWCGQSVSSIGTDDTISGGTAHTPGNTNVFSSWTNFGSTLAQACGAIQLLSRST